MVISKFRPMAVDPGIASGTATIPVAIAIAYKLKIKYIKVILLPKDSKRVHQFIHWQLCYKTSNPIFRSPVDGVDMVSSSEGRR